MWRLVYLGTDDTTTVIPVHNNRHSRVGGNPVWLVKTNPKEMFLEVNGGSMASFLDSRLRGNDGEWS